MRTLSSILTTPSRLKLLIPLAVNYLYFKGVGPIPVTARSKGGSASSLAGIEGSNPARTYGCLSLVSVVCCQVEVSATGRSLVLRSPTKCGACH
jgi:hypothetical protein